MKGELGKIVITGTGRCGTSFLMHLFTALGFNTGYNLDECEQHLKRSGCNGGIEHSIGTELFNKSDIVKNPEWFYKPFLMYNVEIDYIIIPIRDIEAVAASRERIGANKYGGFSKGINDVQSQMEHDRKAFYEFIDYTVKSDLKVIFLDFPRIVEDGHYLWTKLFYNDNIPWSGYDNARHNHWTTTFHEIADPGKVHTIGRQ